MNEPVQQHPDVRDIRPKNGGHCVTFADPVGGVRLEELRQAVAEEDDGATEKITVEMDPDGDPRQVLFTFDPASNKYDLQTLRISLGLDAEGGEDDECE